MNLAALILLFLICPASFATPKCRQILAFMLIALGVSLGLLVFSPEIAWYVGLSGVLHGLAVVCGGVEASRGSATGWLLVICALLKPVWEQFGARREQFEGLLGGSVVVDAHLYGALTGLLIILAPVVWRRICHVRHIYI
jgi:rhomboid family GlyGly-CTERM serine protease